MQHRSRLEREKKELAKERILILFDQARKRFLSDKTLSHRYVVIARKIAMKSRMHMPKEVKRQYCKNCLSFLYPPHNVRTRLQKAHIVTTCLECKHAMRFPYIREQKAKRKASSKTGKSF